MFYRLFSASYCSNKELETGNQKVSTFCVQCILGIAQ